MKSVILLVSVVVLLAHCSSFALAHGSPEHVCMFDQLFSAELMKKRGIETFQNYSEPNPPTASNSAPIRIKFDFSMLTQNSQNQQFTCYPSGPSTVTQYGGRVVSCTDDLILTPQKQAILLKYVADAERILNQALSVIPVQGNLDLTGESQSACQSNVIVPSQYLTDGVPNTDLLVMISAMPGPRAADGSAANVIATGVPCTVDQYKRPVIGAFNFVPTYLTDGADDYYARLYTAVHEITHVLGFGNSTFNILGMLGTDTDNHYNNGGQATLTVMNTPKVLSYVRNFFNCPTMLGAPTEDIGGSGTAGSHWKKRLFMDEYMIGSSVNVPIFSELSLAWFEDTGFYLPNYTVAQKAQWGRGAGCDFVKKTCTSWNQNYICNEKQNKEFMCNMDMKQKAQCQIGPISQAIPTEFQYFGPTNAGSADTLQDFCPIPVPLYACQFTTPPGSYSKVAALEDKLDRGEQNGFSESRCFQSTVIKNVPTGAVSAPTCYRTYCTSPQNLKVMLNKVWYDCPAGQDIEVIIYSGKISCPSNTARVCGGAAIDNTWPVWESVSPSEGEPGTTVTITGKRFTNGSVVTCSGGPTKDMQVLSDTTIVVTLPNYNDIENPSSLLKQVFSIVVTDSSPLGKTAVGYHAFTVTIKLNANLLNAIKVWIVGHWYAVAIAGVVLIVLIVAIRHCCKEKKPEGYDSDA